MPKSGGPLDRILDYRPGNWEMIVIGLVLFLGAGVFVRYKMTGSVNLAAMVDPESEIRQPFWDRNPRLELVTSFRSTSLLVARDKSSGKQMTLDLRVVLPAQLKEQSCGNVDPPFIFTGASNVTCLAIDKPDTGAGNLYITGVSFDAPGKQSDLAQFYRQLFESRKCKVTVMQDSSRATVLEAEDEHGDTVARMAARSSFGNAGVFLAWTAGFLKSQDVEKP